MQLYKCIEKNDKHIAWLYDDKGGSRWVEVMAGQLADQVISISDLKDFDEKVRETIIPWSKL
jgi:autonomous glycyl radical cofactor GrcA